MLRIQTAFTGTLVNGGGVATFHFDTDDASLAQSCSSSVTAFWVDLLSEISDDVTIQNEPTAPVFDTATGTLLTVASLQAQTAITGASTFAPLPPSTQGLLRLKTDRVRANRLTQGRLFIPGVTSDTGNTEPDAAYITNLQAAGQRLIDDGVDAPWSVWSRPRSGFPGQAALITRTEAWNKYAVLRSRRD